MSSTVCRDAFAGYDAHTAAPCGLSLLPPGVVVIMRETQGAVHGEQANKAPDDNSSSETRVNTGSQPWWTLRRRTSRPSARARAWQLRTHASPTRLQTTATGQQRRMGTRVSKLLPLAALNRAPATLYPSQKPHRHRSPRLHNPHLRATET